MDYTEVLDSEILAFIDETLSFYPSDLKADDWVRQREVYNRMAAHFRAKRPEGLRVVDERIAGIPVRLYGDESDVVVLYAHGGGFVLGGLDSHDGVCSEIAVGTGCQVIAIDYRLSPEHHHPAAYHDILAVAQEVEENHKVVLCGDSAGGSLCAALAGTWAPPALVGQVLIYPSLGYEPKGGSFDVHANAPLLSRDELVGYAKIHGGATNDPTATPRAGNLATLPPTILFPAECDPLCDDSLRYRDDATAKGADVTARVSKGLVHGWLRARHQSTRAREEFEKIVGTIKIVCESAKG